MQRTVPRVRQIHLIFRKCGKSDFNARIGVLRLELSGNNQGHDDQTCAIEDRFIMDTIATELPTAKSYAAPGHLGRTSEIGFVQNVRGENLNIELPSDHRTLVFRSMPFTQRVGDAALFAGRHILDRGDVVASPETLSRRRWLNLF